MQIVTFNRRRFREIRENRGLSQADFGASVGASRALIDSIERGLVKPRTVLVEAVCNNYNVSPNHLFNYE